MSTPFLVPATANVPVTALIPRDFIEQARRLGCTTVELLWLLAEDVCVNPPASKENVCRGPLPVRSTLGTVVVPFPPQRRAPPPQPPE